MQCSVVINFATSEVLFLAQCIEEASHFSEEIIVVVCDHFFDGTPENCDLLASIYAAHPEVTFVEYPFSSEHFHSVNTPHLWHNTSRLLGAHHAEPKAEYLLFLDADEIIDGKRFKEWSPHLHHDALHLACYWYFREPTYQAKAWEDTPLLIKQRILSYDLLMHPHERGGTFLLAQANKKRMALGCDGLPMVHHYSWVRSKEAMLRKVRSWGHRSDRDWEALICEEYSRPFSGKDFVHGYEFKTVPSTLKPGSYVAPASQPSNVTRLTLSKLRQIDLEWAFEL